MSFILNDKSLLNELIRIAQQAETPAPATPAPAADPEQIKNIALKLVNNLADHVSAPEGEISAEKSDVKLSSQYLQNLPNFLNFLATNGIAVNNKKIVLKHRPKTSAGMNNSPTPGDIYYDTELNDADKKLYARYSFANGSDVDGDDFDYYVYKDGIVKYLQDLQTQAAENTPRGRMLRVYVKALLEKVDEELEIKVPPPASAVPAGQSPNQQTTQQNNQGNAYQNVGYVTPTGALTQPAVSAMANLELPLVRGQIGFDRIKRFAEAFSKIYPSSEFSRNVITSITGLEEYKVAHILLHQDSYQKIDAEIKANTGNRLAAGDYFDKVEVILTNTKEMLMQIQEMLRRSNSPGALELKAEIDDQINNIYMENSEGIDILQNQAQQVLRDIANHVKSKQTW